MRRLLDSINTINTTSLRIVTSIAVAAILLVMLTVGVLFFAFEPTAKQMTLLYAMGGLLALMMALDVSQFIGKRFSDASYATAKNPAPSSVTVEAPSTVTVDAAPNTPTPRSKKVRR